MKKIFSVILAGVLVAVVCSLALAEEKKESMMGKCMMSGRDMMMNKAKMMGMSSMHGMMKRYLVATSDGGVIVLVGNKLQKYDKNLVLKKEVKIDVDMKDMQNMMKEMLEKCCPMCKMMMKNGMTGKAPEEFETPSESKTE